MGSNQSTQVPPCGVFEILEEQKVVDYGIGVTCQTNVMVTFQKYLNENRKIGRIFFKKSAEDQRFPLSYDLNEEHHDHYIILKAQKTEKLDEENKFVTIVLDKGIETVPKFLSNTLINLADSCKCGYAIGFEKSQGKNILLHKTTFQLDTHIMDLRLKYETAILFIKQNQEYCYGFYEDSEDKSQGCDFYLSPELLQIEEAHEQAFIRKNDVKAVQDPSNKVPYQSIGILRTPSGRGTAQLLKDQKGCRYLITCAHNFIGSDYNELNKLQEYSFDLPKESTFKPLRFKMQKVKNFKIKNVYIPKEYSGYFAVPVAQRPQDKSIVFPAVGNIPEFQSLVSVNTFYDIAIIKLERSLTETHGFTIQDEQPIKNPVEVAGYPQGTYIGPFFGIIEGNIYMQSTASHPNDASYVRLSEDSNGDILLMHKLSTLPGNSGSAIYERLSKSNCRLLAIHTTGIGASSRVNQRTKKEDLYGSYNFGTYIHSKNIKNWIVTVMKR